MQGYGSVNFSFYVAHRGYGDTLATADYATLELQASSDCGQTFTTIWSKSGQTLATTTPASTTTPFDAPEANDWRLENVSVPAAFIGHNTVLFRFRLTDNYSNWIYVDNINITGIVAPPAAPTTLTATAVSQTQINLSWTDNATNETAYKVERSPNGTSGWVEIAGNLPANTTSYSDNGLTANTTYYYRVRASNAGGDSPYSNVADATTQADAPTAINVELNKAVNVYPNPSRGEFVVDASKLGSAVQGVVLYNSLGMAVENRTIQGNMLNLNFSHLPKGVYYLEIYTPIGKVLKKVVIE